MPLVDLDQADRARALGRARNLVTQRGSAGASIRELMIECRANGIPVTLTEMAELVRGDSGLEPADKRGVVRAR